MPTRSTWFRLGRLSLALSTLGLAACASLAPVALTDKDLAPANLLDQQAIRKNVEPITGPLTLDEAMARALKYNLDRRAKLMEEALALGQLEVSQFDMLPKLLAQAGYSWRDNDRVSNSRDPVTGTPVTNRFISSDRTHNTNELGLSWSLLDVGMGYYGSQQQASRLLIAGEKRRKAMHLLMQDVRTAYWRAASAQILRGDVTKTIAMAEEALDDSRKAEAERVRNPLDALRYQRQLLENLRLLESIDQELSSALIDLASLINAPVGQPLSLAQTDLKNISLEATQVPIARLEEAALMQNPDLREQHYNARIAREETRRTMVRLFPNVTFSYGLKYDSDSYLVNRHWNEAGLQMSFNLFNLMTGPTQIRLAEAGVALADQRRMASQMAVITQVHLARLQLINARGQFDRADAIYATDSKIAQVMRSRQEAQAQSKLDAVSNETAAILGLLRRYQALAQVQAAENRLMATLGLEPQIGSTGELSLKDLTDQLGKSAAPWAKLGGKVAQAPADAGQSAAVPVAAAPAALAAAAAPVMAAAKATLVNAPGNVPAKPAASVAGKGKW
jgi:outer membrane protein TolC